MFGHGITYLGIQAITAQTRILGGVQTLYLWSEEQLVHLLERHAEEVLNDSRSLRVELPQRRGLRLQGGTWRTSMTCITVTRLMSLSMRSWMRLCNIGTSFTGPQFSPLLIHDVSCGGGLSERQGRLPTWYSGEL